MIKIDNNKIRIAIALSGGVDSSVVAYLLKASKKYDLIAIFMKNWDSLAVGELQTTDQCDWLEQYNDAKLVAKKLQIPLYLENFEKQYWEKVFKKSLNYLKQGLTPNFDVFCNRFIKFGSFLKVAQEKYNCHLIATGHYANIVNEQNSYFLKQAKDLKKDQTYFLALVKLEVLSKVLFPLGNYLKNEVRLIAKQQHLITHDKKDSTGICFVGERNFPAFIENFLPKKAGQIIDVESKDIVGKHDGYYFYTLGQRKNLNIYKNNFSYFVYSKDIDKNIVYVVKGKDNSKLLVQDFLVEIPKWLVASYQTKTSFNCLVKIRHSEKAYSAFVIKAGNYYQVHLKNATKLLTPGQICVFYVNQICLGGAMIVKLLRESLVK